MKTTIKIKFRPSTVENRPGTIVYLVIRHREVRQITTDYKLFSTEWNESLGTIVPPLEGDRHDTVVELQQCVNHDMARLNTIIAAHEKQSCDYKSDDIVAEFNPTNKRRPFFAFMESVIDDMRKQKTTSTIKNYQAALNKFREFRGGEDIPLGKIDQKLMNDYQDYLKASGSMPNTIAFHARILRATYNRAVNRQLITDRKPFQNVFTSIAKTKKKAISKEDISRLFHLDLHQRPDLEQARDIFMFLFFCRGMSFIDAAFLKKTDVRDGVITYRRHKTGQQLSIKMTKETLGIVGRYTKGDSPYLLDLMSCEYKNERKPYDTLLRMTNRRLKTIGRMAGIVGTLSTVTARHSWATIAKKKNVPVNVISDALGHGSIRTTQIYLAEMDASAIDKANDLIISDL